MPWVNGVYVAKQRDSSQFESIASGSVNTVVVNDVDQDSFAENFFDESFISTRFSSGSFTASVLKRLLPKRVISAANDIRSLFEPGFVNTELIEDGAVTGAKISNPIKLALINGGSAGTHTVTGIKITDELISVLEQNGTSGILTDLTTEFSIVKSDTISNSGGTATSSDKLIILYLSK
jgi:hypothetical protein